MEISETCSNLNQATRDPNTLNEEYDILKTKYSELENKYINLKMMNHSNYILINKMKKLLFEKGELSIEEKSLHGMELIERSFAKKEEQIQNLKKTASEKISNLENENFTLRMLLSNYQNDIELITEKNSQNLEMINNMKQIIIKELNLQDEDRELSGVDMVKKVFKTHYAQLNQIKIKAAETATLALKYFGE